MVASPDAYRRALTTLEEKGWFENNRYRDLLRAQYARPGHTATATQLAEAVGYENFSAANLNYGRLAGDVAGELGYQPPLGKDGKPQWYRTLATVNLPSQSTNNGHYEFVMIPELASALEALGWVEKPVKTYRLLGPDGETVESTVPGELGGNSNEGIYGRLDCTAANNALAKGYAQHRVFFANEEDAIAAGYRPCHRCMRERHQEWSRGPEGNDSYPWKKLP